MIRLEFSSVADVILQMWIQDNKIYYIRKHGAIGNVQI